MTIWIRVAGTWPSRCTRCVTGPWKEEAVAQARNTLELDPGWPPSWRQLRRALFKNGEYAEGQEAAVERARLENADVDAAREVAQAEALYHQTGEPQSFSSAPPAVRYSSLRSTPILDG